MKGKAHRKALSEPQNPGNLLSTPHNGGPSSRNENNRPGPLDEQYAENVRYCKSLNTDEYSQIRLHLS